MNDQSYGTTPEQMIENARKFQEWANEQGYGISNLDEDMVSKTTILSELTKKRNYLRLNAKRYKSLHSAANVVQECIDIVQAVKGY